MEHLPQEACSLVTYGSVAYFRGLFAGPFDRIPLYDVFQDNPDIPNKPNHGDSALINPSLSRI